MENPHKRMTQKSTSSPQTHFEEILRSQHLIMCCCPFPLCSPLLSLSRAPTPPLLPGCPGDSERHFFPEAPLSPTALFSLLCWQAHRWRRESERGEGGGDASPKTLQASGGRQGGRFRNGLRWDADAVVFQFTCFDVSTKDAAVMLPQQRPLHLGLSWYSLV